MNYTNSVVMREQKEKYILNRFPFHLQVSLCQTVPVFTLAIERPRETFAKSPRDIPPASSKASAAPKGLLSHFETVPQAPKVLGRFSN